MTMNETWRRLRNLLRRRDIEDGLDEELRFHIEQQAAKNLRAGMTADEARRQARIRFGGAEAAKEHTRDQVRFVHLEDTLRDVRYSVRALRRAPGFTLAAVLTLALGIGATAAIFSVVYGVLLKPLPYPDEDRLVSLSHAAPGVGVDDIGMAAPMWITYRDETRAFDAVGLWQPGMATVVGPNGPEEILRVTVTQDALEALGTQPVLGRWFSAQEDAPGGPGVVLLSYGYWHRVHGGVPDIIGRSVTLDGEVREVVGVMPRAFRMPAAGANAEVILPARINRDERTFSGFTFRGVARLRPGVTLDDARADVTRMLRIWLDAWPQLESAQLTPVIVPLRDTVVGDIGRMLWIVMATIVIVWLIACANVANLLLVRAEGRQQELALRAALGAGWRRIARSLLVESLLLSALGGVLGVGVAYAAVRTIVALEPVGLPRVDELGLDPIVLLFVAAASVLSGLLFGAIPTSRHARPRLVLARRGTGRTMSDSRERHHTRNALVVVQVGLALVLLAGAGLMIRTFQALRAVEPGFTRPGEVQTLRLTIPVNDVADPEQVTRLQQVLTDSIAAVPGVVAVSFGSSAPLGGASWNPVFIEGHTYADGELPPARRQRWVAPGYFDTLGTPLVAGRDLTWAELYQRHPVAIVSEGLARAIWGEPAAALGRRIREHTQVAWREIVGVTADVRDDGMAQPAPATVYWPALQDVYGRTRPTRSATFIVRSSRTGTDGLLADLRAAVHDVSESVSIGQVRTLAEVYERSMALTSFALVTLALAAAMALVLGVVGIYGVVAYAVARRTREIGIRLALGASQGTLRGMFVRDGVRLAAVGVVCGLVGTIAATRLMSSLLFGVSALDPTTYVLGALVLLAAAALASFVPTVRATRTPLADVLRAE